MRIISKFHDYYDVVMKQGMDKDVVYVRETEEIRIFDQYRKNIVSPENRLVDVVKQLPQRDYVQDHSKDEAYGIEYQMVGIAGKWYVVGHMQVSGFGITRVNEVFCNPDEFVELLKRYDSKKLWKMYNDTGGRSTASERAMFKYWGYFHNSENGVKGAFGLANELSDELFLKYNTPVIVLRQKWIDRRGVVWTMNINGCLKDTGIVKILDPFTCYQEIYMYMGGVLRKKENDTVVISDNDMRDKKGFDKWSFRKMSSKAG